MKKSFAYLESNRFYLKPIADDDLVNIHKGLSHPDVIKYYGVSFMTLEATQEQMDWYADLIKNETGIWWGVFSKSNNEFVGAGGLNDLCKIKSKAEIGFWLLPEYWGIGIMTETMPILLNYAFAQLKLQRIEGFVETDNKNCKKALDKLGFKLEQTMENCEEKDGQLISLDVYAKINLS